MQDYEDLVPEPVELDEESFDHVSGGEGCHLDPNG